MLLVTTTHQPASDLGFLLHKNPGKVHEFELTFGKVIVAFPEVTETRCTAAILLDLDGVRLVRGSKEARGSLASYVNDRSYAASSFLSVAIAEVFSTAMTGRSKERPELAAQPIPLEIQVPVLRCRGGADLLQRLFEPLGFEVETTQALLDPEFPEWGQSPYVDLRLRGTVLLSDALRQLYVILPAIDAQKHYYMDPQEVQKLLHKGEGWLATHPERSWIVRAYLNRRPSFVRDALEQLANAEESLQIENRSVDEVLQSSEQNAPAGERGPSLHKQRHDRVIEKIRELRPKSVVDLGCGEGKLIRDLIKIQGLDRIVGMDVSYYELEKAERRLRLDEAGPRLKERVQLIHGSLMYRDARIEGFDCCTVIEVIEHLDPPRLRAFSEVVFGRARPKTVLLTTPNREYNARYGLTEMRHHDHRFEWSRGEFADWCQLIGQQYGYTFNIEGVGEEDPDLGAPSQMGVFSR